MKLKKVGRFPESGQAHVFIEEDEDGNKYARKVAKDRSPRFKKEIELLIRAQGTPVVDVLDSQTDSDPFWYLMKLYPSSMANVLDALIADPILSKEIFSKILDAVKLLHERKIAHRDLKPDNILLDHDDTLILSDLGLSRSLEPDTSRMTVVGGIGGTINYMAPEQFSALETSDHRADIFALGRMLLELHTERLAAPQQDLDDYDLTPPVIAVIKKATAIKAEKRYQSVDEFINAVQKLEEQIDESRRYKFAPYFTELILYMWNDGQPKEVSIQEIRESVGASAYGNHRKLSFTPWRLVENGINTKSRKLTQRGIEFAQGNLQVPATIAFDHVTSDYVPIDNDGVIGI